MMRQDGAQTCTGQVAQQACVGQVDDARRHDKATGCAKQFGLQKHVAHVSVTCRSRAGGPAPDAARSAASAPLPPGSGHYSMDGNQRPLAGAGSEARGRRRSGRRPGAAPGGGARRGLCRADGQSRRSTHAGRGPRPSRSRSPRGAAPTAAARYPARHTAAQQRRRCEHAGPASNVVGKWLCTRQQAAGRAHLLHELPPHDAPGADVRAQLPHLRAHGGHLLLVLRRRVPCLHHLRADARRQRAIAEGGRPEPLELTAQRRHLPGTAHDCRVSARIERSCCSCRYRPVAVGFWAAFGKQARGC